MYVGDLALCKSKIPLSLPSPARGEGFEALPFDRSGKGEGDNSLK